MCAVPWTQGAEVLMPFLSPLIPHLAQHVLELLLNKLIGEMPIPCLSPQGGMWINCSKLISPSMQAPGNKWGEGVGGCCGI